MKQELLASNYYVQLLLLLPITEWHAQGEIVSHDKLQSLLKEYE